MQVHQCFGQHGRAVTHLAHTQVQFSMKISCVLNLVRAPLGWAHLHSVSPSAPRAFMWCLDHHVGGPSTLGGYSSYFDVVQHQLNSVPDLSSVAWSTLLQLAPRWPHPTEPSHAAIASPPPAILRSLQVQVTCMQSRSSRSSLFASRSIASRSLLVLPMHVVCCPTAAFDRVALQLHT